MSNLRNQEVIVNEKSTYKSIYQKRPMRYRLYETFVYGMVMFVLAGYISIDSTGYKILAILSAIVIIGGAPTVYQKYLRPEYTLTKQELVIAMKGKEQRYLLTDVERTSAWMARYRLKDKKEPLMVSSEFITKLDSQLNKIHRLKKR